MATYYAFLNEDDICWLVAYPNYEISEGVFPYDDLDYSSDNESCIPLPDTIESYEEASATYSMKQYNRETQTWGEIIPESNSDDVMGFDSLSEFPQRGETVADDPLNDAIYIDRETNRTYRWDTDSRSYVEINERVTVVNSLTSTSTTNALSAAQGKALNDNKVDKVSGKGLSTNDYTTTEKNKLAGIATGADKTTIVNNLTSTSTTSALSANMGKVLNEKFVELSPDDATAVQTINSPVTVNGVLRSAQGQIYYATSDGATLSTNNLDLTIAAKDTCTINAKTTQLYNIAARGSNAYDIGTSTVRFRNIYLNNSPNVASDGRAKKDIYDANSEELVDFINKINICNFKYKDDETEKERIGVIAQQLIEANPNVADYFVEHDPEADFYSVKPADLVFPLISYVQYLEKRIEKLEGAK